VFVSHVGRLLSGTNTACSFRFVKFQNDADDDDDGEHSLIDGRGQMVTGQTETYGNNRPGGLC